MQQAIAIITIPFCGLIVEFIVGFKGKVVPFSINRYSQSFVFDVFTYDKYTYASITDQTIKPNLDEPEPNRENS